MERGTWHEFCCGSQAVAGGFCLHVAVFYTRCPRTCNPNPPTMDPTARAATVAAQLGGMPSLGALPPPTELPPRAGTLKGAGRLAAKPMSRYGIYHVVCEGPELSLHKIFVHITNEGHNRGEYLHLTGCRTSGLHYSEVRGAEPECALQLSLRAKTLVGTIAPADLDRFKDICRRNPPPLYLDPESDNRALAWTPLKSSREWTSSSIAKADRAGILDISLAGRSLQAK